MPLIRIVPSSARKCTYAGTFLIKCREFSFFLSFFFFFFFFCNCSMKHLHMKKMWHMQQATQNMRQHILFVLFLYCTQHSTLCLTWWQLYRLNIHSIWKSLHLLNFFHIYICVKISSHVCFTVVLCNKRHYSKNSRTLITHFSFIFSLWFTAK